ncbi:MAG: Hsp20/alpha crystallin family protein [SAR202 cluster bacterium]|nr:Hsp20/alpha crystallin family protein [SAR202 cluster bacterium]
MAKQKKEVQKALTAANGGRLRTYPARLDDVDRWFDQAFRGMWPTSPLFTRWPRLASGSGWNPSVDIIEKDGHMLVKADLPGVKKDDVDVSVEGDALVIKGRRKEAKDVDEADYRLSERMEGEYYRSIPLPEGANADGIDATYEDGVLEVKIPLAEQPKKKARKVKVS